MIASLQYITHYHPVWSPSEQIRKALEAGITWVQLRMKEDDDFVREHEAIASMEWCEKFGATLIINDHVELAHRVMAHGVHLGQTDMPPSSARSILGEDAIIGLTCNTQEQLEQAEKQDINYIGLGPYRFTSTKKLLSPELGLSGLDLTTQSTFPVVAVGGIRLSDFEAISTKGVHGVAFSSLLLQSENWPKTVQEMKAYYD